MTAKEPAPAAPKPFSVLEFIDVTADATQLGLRCEVMVSSSLAEQLAPARVVERLRDALRITERDPQLERFRAIAFYGAVRPERPLSRLWKERWGELSRFCRRARVGIGGVHEAGHLLAFSVDAVMVIAQANSATHLPLAPRLYLDTIESFLGDDIAEDSAR
jgi:hypothetical protein